MDTKAKKTAWQQANRTGAGHVQTLLPEQPEGKSTCPFCGSDQSLHAFDLGGFHCFGECGGPTGQTYTNTEVVARANGITLNEARERICAMA